MKLLILAVAVTLGKHIAISEKDLGKTKVFSCTLFCPDKFVIHKSMKRSLNVQGN